MQRRTAVEWGVIVAIVAIALCAFQSREARASGHVRFQVHVTVGVPVFYSPYPNGQIYLQPPPPPVRYYAPPPVYIAPYPSVVYPVRVRPPASVRYQWHRQYRP